MWSHFILALILLATFIECRTDAEKKKRKAAIIKRNKKHEAAIEEYPDVEYHDAYFQESEEKKVIEVFNSNRKYLHLKRI